RSFFFQAEDGIRDRTVTGVQTCALPISTQVLSRAFPVWDGRVGRALPIAIRPSLELVAEACDAEQIKSECPENCCLSIEDHDGRSEERRVGKECRCGRLSGSCRKMADCR